MHDVADRLAACEPPEFVGPARSSALPPSAEPARAPALSPAPAAQAAPAAVTPPAQTTLRGTASEIAVTGESDELAVPRRRGARAVVLALVGVAAAGGLLWVGLGSDQGTPPGASSSSGASGSGGLPAQAVAAPPSTPSREFESPAFAPAHAPAVALDLARRRLDRRRGHRRPARPDPSPRGHPPVSRRGRDRAHPESIRTPRAPRCAWTATAGCWEIPRKRSPCRAMGAG